MRISLLFTLVLLAGVPAHAQQTSPAPTPTETREANLGAYTELLRSDLRTQKVAIITEMMEFTEEEDAKFWPIYREYEADLAKINDGRMALIVDYGNAYSKMTDDIADKLIQRALDLEAQRTALKAKYFGRLKAVLPTITAARFMQVEQQILLLLDLQIAAALPIVK
jgi:hypothetical protein